MPQHILVPVRTTRVRIWKTTWLNPMTHGFQNSGKKNSLQSKTKVFKSQFLQLLTEPTRAGRHRHQSAFYEDKRRGSNLCSHTETLQSRSQQPKSLCWLHLPLHHGYFCTSSWTERERTYTTFPWQHEKIQLSQLTSLITSIYIDSYRCCKRWKPSNICGTKSLPKQYIIFLQEKEL